MPQLSELSLSGSAGTAIATSSSVADSERRERWEKGAVDYTGEDRSVKHEVKYGIKSTTQADWRACLRAYVLLCWNISVSIFIHYFDAPPSVKT